MWDVLDSGRSPVQEIMDRDGALLKSTDPKGHPLFHFYDFESPSATYGYFTKVDTLLNHEALKRWGVKLGKRVTGGGVIFHLTDLPFSILLPSCHPGFSQDVLSCYSYLNHLVLQAIGRFLGKVGDLQLLKVEEVSSKTSSCSYFCMAQPTRYDVIFEGRKVAGAAVRRLKTALLYHGSIALGGLSDEFAHDVLLSKDVAVAMKRNTYPLLGNCWQQERLEAAREEMRNLLREGTRNL